MRDEFLVVLLIGVLIAVVLAGCGQSEAQTRIPGSPPRTTVDTARIEPQVARFCGDCHATPHAETFPKEAWRREVDRGFRFYADSDRRDLEIPAFSDVVAYYEALAPERLILLPAGSAMADQTGAIQFRPTSSSAPQVEPPAVSFVGWVSLPGRKQHCHLFCDMRSGLVGVADTSAQNVAVEELTTLSHPSRVALGDLDGDGLDEILIADLGSFSSEDHRRGAVVWLRWDATNESWRQRLLVSGLGRVADVRPGDFDGDGDADLVVAEFGHLRTGRVLLYENRGVKQGVPELREHLVDHRHGAIDVPTADLNGDGRLDFVALISQEHEVVEAYLNTGQLTFRRETIFAARDPAYGSSSIDLADLDGDGDLDVVYANGDTFGSDFLKPYHGISWLENQGRFPFVEHRLATMIGVQSALSTDLDGDNDLDIAAVGFLPRNLVGAAETANHDSLLWLEQKEPGRFVRHSLEAGRFLHAALAVGDYDEDGDADLAVGNFQDLAGSHQPWLTVWRNSSAKRATRRIP